MKKIINGAKYDTSTAKCLGYSEYGNPSDLNYCHERLFRTKSGKYFLHGEGGAMSKYSKSCGDNHWTGDEQIQPMSRLAAEGWAEEKLSGEEYEAAFGDVEDGTESLNLNIDAQLKAKLWQMAEERKITVSAVAEEILRRSL